MKLVAVFHYDKNQREIKEEQSLRESCFVNGRTSRRRRRSSPYELGKARERGSSSKSATDS